jgi:cyclopropane-fatty-acyl-phospholipid synthase
MDMFWQRHLEAFAARLRPHDIPVLLQLWNGTEVALGETPTVALRVRSPAALKQLLNPSLASLGHAYVEGEIDVEGRTADIVDVAARLASHGPETGRALRRGPRMTRHTRSVDAEAIAYHYDVSNAFYALWLDSQMVYSCAYFRSPDDTLDDAQTQKIDHVLRKLRVRPGDRLLDIGCGWGALVLRAAQRFGARSLGITLSRNQYEYARERIAAAGLADRCEVQLADYRDVTGKYDRIASVGMFEHVGLQNLHGYFARMRDLLADDGTFLNHGITSTDPDSAEAPWGGGEFIERYVFPHGELPHLSLALREMCAGGLEPVDVENLRRHYALTLDHWARRFEAAAPRLREIAGERRYRIWRVFLAGCADGFAQHRMSLFQILAVGTGAGALPLTRDYMYGAYAPS